MYADPDLAYWGYSRWPLFFTTKTSRDPNRWDPNR